MNETEQLLELLNSTFPDITTMTALEARAAVDSRIRPAENLSDAQTHDHTIAAPHGALRVRVYRQEDGGGSPALPVTIYAHGGGFLHGSIEGHDSFCRTWSKRTGMTVVSVDYRLAPEWGAPAAAEDLVTTAHWALAEGLGSRVLLAGDSSGANAAAVASAMLVAETSNSLAGQVLITPFLDPRMSTETYRTRAEGYFITARILETYWSHYLGAPGTAEAEPWQVNPTLAPNLADLPPTIVITAGLDPLSAEGRAYHHALTGEGVTSLHRHYPDQFHGFFTIPRYGPAVSATDILWADLTALINNTEHHA